MRYSTILIAAALSACAVPVTVAASSTPTHAASRQLCRSYDNSEDCITRGERRFAAEVERRVTRGRIVDVSCDPGQVPPPEAKFSCYAYRTTYRDNGSRKRKLVATGTVDTATSRVTIRRAR